VSKAGEVVKDGKMYCSNPYCQSRYGMPLQLHKPESAKFIMEHYGYSAPDPYCTQCVCLLIHLASDHQVHVAKQHRKGW